MSNNAYWWGMIDGARLKLNKPVVDKEEVLEFQASQGGWEPQPKDIQRLRRRDLEEAIRARTTTDDAGNEVRSEHVMRVAQKTMFGNIDTAPLEFLHRSLLSRQAQCVGDARKIVADRDYIERRRSRRIELFPEVEELATRRGEDEAEAAA